MARPLAFSMLSLTTAALVAGCACSRCESETGAAAATTERSLHAAPEHTPMAESRGALRAGSWTISSLPGADLTRATNLPTLVIDEEGEASGTSGVNTFNATIETDASGAIRFAELIYTEMAGSQEAMAIESVFFRALASADGASRRDGRLELTSGGEVVAVFEEQGGSNARE
ncbi:MAG: META domain-containing protein [Phycisphaerales bacterium]|nr:META domain-containing protein [Phycisphaerales bacterium]